jgi:hypothetical protein
MQPKFALQKMWKAIRSRRQNCLCHASGRKPTWALLFRLWAKNAGFHGVIIFREILPACLGPEKHALPHSHVFEHGLSRVQLLIASDRLVTIRSSYLNASSLGQVLETLSNALRLM